MGKRSTKKRGRTKKGQTRRYRFMAGGDCTEALDTCNSLIDKLKPLAEEVTQLHEQLKKNAEEMTPEAQQEEEGVEGAMGATVDDNGAKDPMQFVK